MFLVFKARISKHNQQGFSLLEVAISLILLGLLLYGMVKTNVVNRDYDQFKDNRIQLQEIRESLLLFAQTNAYLPCPDTSGDGLENRASGGECVRNWGALPHQMLGVKELDVWQQPYFYSVNGEADSTGVIEINDPTESASFFSTASLPSPGFRLSTPPIANLSGSGNFDICGEVEANACGASPAVTATDNKIELSAILVVVSFGENAVETWPVVGNVPAGLLSDFETENADTDGYFWHANQSREQFDDQMIWLTANEIKYALLKSERRLE